MAARRSRLQIKPNILGGPKGPGPKSTPKALGKDSDKESATKIEDRDNKNTKKNIQIDAKEKNSIDIEDKDETQAKTTITDVKEDNADIKKPEIKTDTPNVNKTDKSDAPALPARARLRKFGKVNLSAARGAASGSQPEKQSTENTTTDKTRTEKHDGDFNEATNEVVKKEETSVEKKDTEDGSKTNAVVQRRARFPKAKPNLADAGRRRQKEPANKGNTSSVTEPAKNFPEIIVSKSEVKAASQLKPDTSEVLPSTPTMTQLQPKLPVTPTSIMKSPLKHPTPTIPVSPEKRARTLSTSEPQVVKRQRKPKVTAPTDQPPDRSTMKMRDLIRWNPSNNPMKPKVKAGTAAISKTAEKENLEEEVVMGEEVEMTKVPETEPDDTALPVPQVTIGPDGNIVINERSLVVKGPDVGKDMSKDHDIIDETDMITTYGSFRTRNRSKRWSKKDTKKFYKALAMIGIDFFLINQLFPNRTRLDIKKKFKKEEKVNKALVDKVLKERIIFDPTVFDDVIDESSDEEEPKETKKKEKKTKPKDQNKAKGPAQKRTSKRKRGKTTYFEDDTSEEEVEFPWKLSKSKSGPLVSHNDGEVVDILMDMSKGRIRGEGHESGLLDTSGRLTAVPANKVHTQGSFIPIEAKTSKSRSQNQQDPSFENVPVSIPGIQSISILQAQKMEAGPSVTMPETGSSRQTIEYSDSENSNRRIYIPNLNRTSQAVQSNVQSTANVLNQVQYTSNQSVVTGTSSSHLQPDISRVHLQPGTSLTQLQNASSLLQPGPGSENQLQQVQVNSMPVIHSAQVSPEDADQYVLVTVMPEGGGETVIHIYRLHGGDQSQNQIMYADQHASQQMTLNNINTVDQTQDQVLGDEPLTVNDSQSVDTTPSYKAVKEIASEVISDAIGTTMAEEPSEQSECISTQQSNCEEIVDTPQSDLQLTSDKEKLLMLQTYKKESQPDNTTRLNESDIQIIVTNENETDKKNDINIEVSMETVTTDALSENNLTNLNLNSIEIENR